MPRLWRVCADRRGAALSLRYRRNVQPDAGMLHPRRRCVMVVVLCGVLAGCGAARQVIPEEGGEPTSQVNLSDALANCRNAFADQIAQAVPRADCIVRATELAVRPGLPFPELLDRENGIRKALAGQVQSGSVSLLERNRQIAKAHQAIVAEEADRLRTAPSEERPVSPIAVTEWRASNPDACAGLGGNSAICY